jgi:hypothetical protein
LLTSDFSEETVDLLPKNHLIPRLKEKSAIDNELKQK